MAPFVCPFAKRSERIHSKVGKNRSGGEDLLLGFTSLEAMSSQKLVGSRVQNVECWREKPMLARAKL